MIDSLRKKLKKIVIFGAGGHAKVVADAIIKAGQYEIAAFVDSFTTEKNVLGIQVITEDQYFSNPIVNLGVVGIGDNSTREKVAQKILSQVPSFEFITVIHPSAQIATHTFIDKGTVVFANSVINVSTHIGKHCIVNTSASVDHDCFLEDFSSVAPNVCLGGRCRVGAFSVISIGAVLIHNIEVGPFSVVGAGSLVTKKIPEFSVYYGVPAKKIRSRQKNDKYL